MAILGAHQSIAGGYYKAVERAHLLGCDCVQLFTKNASQWAPKTVAPEDARLFRKSLHDLGVTHPIAHDSYLINLASPDARLWKKSVEALAAELERAEALDIPYVVTHPGAFTSETEEAGLRNVIRALDEIHRQCGGLRARCLLETTAGQGTSLGWRFDQFRVILDGLKEADRLAFCFDTCHVFAAGYPLSTRKGYDATMADFDRLVGLGRIKAFHLNDSRGKRGSRIDRHEHIGHGRLGKAAFRLLLGDDRFRQVPMYLETNRSFSLQSRELKGSSRTRRSWSRARTQERISRLSSPRLRSNGSVRSPPKKTCICKDRGRIDTPGPAFSFQIRTGNVEFGKLECNHRGGNTFVLNSTRYGLKKTGQHESQRGLSRCRHHRRPDGSPPRILHGPSVTSPRGSPGPRQARRS